MLDLAKSISNEGASEQLGAHTSMHDLVVTALPASDGYVDHVRVHLDLDHGLVRIEHVASAGGQDTIERPSNEILPLFWRFMIEKFGVRPARDFAQAQSAPSARDRGAAMTDHLTAYSPATDSRSTGPHRDSPSIPTPFTNYR
jgi:hypothetical protein